MNRLNAMKKNTRSHLFRVLGILGLVALAGTLESDATGGNSVVQFMTAKSLPAATVSVIDPESGTSQGTAGSDVNIAVGDIILFRFSVASAPATAIDGIQSYITEYVPDGTQVVGARFLDENGNTLEPRRAGLAIDGCSSGAQCNNFNAVPSDLCVANGTCNWSTATATHGPGSVAQVMDDTGIFFSTDARTKQSPNNAFLTLDNGIAPGYSGNDEPRAIDPTIVALLGDTSAPYFAHNAWDLIQVKAYASQNSTVIGGSGNPPYKYGSLVAGPDTFYPFEATADSDGGRPAELNDVTGPWQRMKSPGSQKGSGTQPPSNPSGGKAVRLGVDKCALNFPGPINGASGKTLYPTPSDCAGTETDVTPANPVSANAVRWALGDPRVGEIRYVEIALRVTSVPISSTFGTSGGNVDCGEVSGSDISNKLSSTGGDNLAWPSYIGHPQCVFLRLKLDVTPDKKLASTGDHITYTIFGKNLSVNNETNAKFFLEFDGSSMAFVSASPAPTRTVTCNGGKTCEEYDLGTLAPSNEFNLSVVLGVGGIGGITDVVTGQYQSDQLDAIDPNGFQTTALTVVGKATEPVISLTNHLDPTASFAPAGTATWQVDGTITNLGTDVWTAASFRPFLPAGWSITASSFKIGTTTLTCATTGTDTDDSSALAANSPRCAYAGTLNAGASAPITFKVTVPAAATTGLYDLDIRTVGSQQMFQSFEAMFHKALIIPVGEVRTAKPVITCPINSTAPSISGTSEPNATIRLLFDLMQRNLPGPDTANASGVWTISDYTAFGELYGGLEVKATAQAPGKLESDLADGCTSGVTEVKQCSDGIDNDGDGLIDFPADPGCTSLGDNSEIDPVFPQCSDRIDNDGDGFIDFPYDPQCSSMTDNDEAGGPTQCTDGIDNDGDGQIDGADPDCSAPNSLGREVTLRQCQDGIDNDSDGHIDFPADPGCDSAFDDSELDISSVLDTKGRLLIAMDTSGSMNGITCAADTFTGGDGSTECPGADQACATCANNSCGNTQPDDSRLFQVTDGMSNVVAAFGDVDYGLMRFHESSEPFSCPTSFATEQSGGWQGGGIAPCTGGYNAGDVLVSFDPNNEEDILNWMDHDDDYNGVPPPGTDWELRGSGTTPLAGILSSAKSYLDTVKAADTSSSCRPYRIILVTDGNETCGGNPVTAAAAAFAAGYPVNVIGMATTDAPTIAQLNSIASAGGTGSAFFVNDQAGLSNAMAQIIQASILVEKCNGVDDDCDGLVDEGYNIGAACDNGELGQCFRTGTVQCTGTLTSGCNAPQVTGTPEICNGLDDDCDGLIDEDLGTSCTCNPLPEICNGLDDDCDGLIDEGVLPGVGDACGPSQGACTPGAIACVNGGLVCQGGTGPTPEICNGIDDDCDGFVDEVSNPCYTFPAGCTQDPVSGNYTCQGICQTGVQDCTDIANGVCPGEVGPATEICNGVDDDCDGVIDNGFPVGQACNNGEQGACFATGVWECNAQGGVSCTAPQIQPGTETCNGLDDDCDGVIDEAADLGPPIGNTCGTGGACGFGTFQCQNSLGQTNQPDDQVVCVGSQTGTAEVCNGLDDDCDGIIDEDVPGMGVTCLPAGDPTGLHYPPGTCATGAVCDDPISVCRLGATACLGGSVQCPGWVGPSPEIPCNGIDEDCNGSDDTTCPQGEACVQGGCRLPCLPGEFPCPLGQYCDTTDAPSPGVCVPDPCASITCPPGSMCDRTQNPPACVDLCDSVTCPTGLMCVNGICQDCFTLGCPQNQICVRDPNSGDGVCTADLCAGVTCDPGQFCQNGTCMDSTCNPACGTNQVCINTQCQNACTDCQVGQVCDYNSGQCIDDQCIDANGNQTSCPPGDVCNPYTGQCESDPCSQLQCGAGTECVILPDGTASCFNPPPPPKTVIYAGGGGCNTGGSSGGASFLLVGAIALLVRRRRRS